MKVWDTEQFKLCQEIYARDQGDEPILFHKGSTDFYLWSLSLCDVAGEVDFFEVDPLQMDDEENITVTHLKELKWVLNFYTLGARIPGEKEYKLPDDLLQQDLSYDDPLVKHILECARHQRPEIIEKELYKEYGSFEVN